MTVFLSSTLLLNEPGGVYSRSPSSCEREGGERKKDVSFSLPLSLSDPHHQLYTFRIHGRHSMTCLDLVGRCEFVAALSTASKDPEKKEEARSRVSRIGVSSSFVAGRNNDESHLGSSTWATKLRVVSSKFARSTIKVGLAR